MELMANSNPAKSLGQVGSKGDWLKRLGKVGDHLQLLSLLSYLLIHHSPLSAMSPSSVRNNGIKGVDTDALLYLGLKVRRKHCHNCGDNANPS